MRTIILIVFFFSASAASATPREIPTSELSLGGIVIDISEEQVRAILGEPLSVSEEADYLNLHFRYPHVTISFNGETVAGLFSSSPKGCTPAGLCPGDPMSRAKMLYGEPEVAARETGTFWEYYTDCPCWLQISPQGGKVGSIRVACQP